MQQVITTNEWVYLQNKSDEFSEKRNQKVWPALDKQLRSLTRCVAQAL